MSNSVIRVKREVQSAKDDKFEDIEMVTVFCHYHKNRNAKFYLNHPEILLA